MNTNQENFVYDPQSQVPTNETKKNGDVTQMEQNTSMQPININITNIPQQENNENNINYNNQNSQINTMQNSNNLVMTNNLNKASLDNQLNQNMNNNVNMPENQNINNDINNINNVYNMQQNEQLQNNQTNQDMNLNNNTTLNVIPNSINLTNENSNNMYNDLNTFSNINNINNIGINQDNDRNNFVGVFSNQTSSIRDNFSDNDYEMINPQPENKYINTDFDRNSTALTDLKNDPNAMRVDYSTDPTVRANMEKIENEKNTITITSEAKVFLIIIGVLLVFTFIIPYIFDAIKNTG